MPWVKVKETSAAEREALDRNYRGRVRFLVDESVGHTVAEILQDWGYNTRYVADDGLLGHSDEDVFASAWKAKRVIVTHDPDFLDDRRFPPHRNPGIVLVRPGSNGRENEGLGTCLRNAIAIAGENADWYRGRKLDFSSQDMLTITSQGTRARFLWDRQHDEVLTWED